MSLRYHTKLSCCILRDGYYIRVSSRCLLWHLFFHLSHFYGISVNPEKTVMETLGDAWKKKATGYIDEVARR